MGWSTIQDEDLKFVREALEWYAEEARAVGDNLIAQKDQAVLASVTVLGMDYGLRAKQALERIKKC